MITKSRIVGLLTILVVGFLVLRTEEEPSDMDHRNGDAESATNRQFQPREPAFLKSTRDYEIARQHSTGRASRPYGKPESYWQESYSEIPSDGYGTPAPYGQQARLSVEGYRFRPLSEQEQVRVRERYPSQYSYQYTAPYNSPSQTHPSSEMQSQSYEPTPYSPQGTYLDPLQEAYSFRPLENSPGARGRWQGPYQKPGQRYDRYPQDNPWATPSNPQWGSTPPAQRMYPSFYQDPGRRITAR